MCLHEAYHYYYRYEMRRALSRSCETIRSAITLALPRGFIVSTVMMAHSWYRIVTAIHLFLTFSWFK